MLRMSKIIKPGRPLVVAPNNEMGCRRPGHLLERIDSDMRWARRVPVTQRELPPWARARARSGILRRPYWSGFAADEGRHPIQDQIKAKLEIVLKIGLRIGLRRLKDPGTYRSSQHWKSALVNQLSKELTVRQR